MKVLDVAKMNTSWIRVNLRFLLILVAAVAVALAVGVKAYDATRHRLVVENLSGQTIEHVSVTVCGRKHEFEDLAAGQIVSFVIVVDRDGDFDVKGKLADGTAFGGNCGYVTGGEYGRDRIVVLPRGALDLQDDKRGTTEIVAPR